MSRAYKSDSGRRDFKGREIYNMARFTSEKEFCQFLNVVPNKREKQFMDSTNRKLKDDIQLSPTEQDKFLEIEDRYDEYNDIDNIDDLKVIFERGKIKLTQFQPNPIVVRSRDDYFDEKFEEKTMLEHIYDENDNSNYFHPIYTFDREENSDSSIPVQKLERARSLLKDSIEIIPDKTQSVTSTSGSIPVVKPNTKPINSPPITLSTPLVEPKPLPSFTMERPSTPKEVSLPMPTLPETVEKRSNKPEQPKPNTTRVEPIRMEPIPKPKMVEVLPVLEPVTFPRTKTPDRKSKTIPYKERSPDVRNIIEQRLSKIEAKKYYQKQKEAITMWKKITSNELKKRVSSTINSIGVMRESSETSNFQIMLDYSLSGNNVFKRKESALSIEDAKAKRLFMTDYSFIGEDTAIFESLYWSQFNHEVDPIGKNIFWKLLISEGDSDNQDLSNWLCSKLTQNPFQHILFLQSFWYPNEANFHLCYSKNMENEMYGTNAIIFEMDTPDSFNIQHESFWSQQATRLYAMIENCRVSVPIVVIFDGFQWRDNYGMKKKLIVRRLNLLRVRQPIRVVEVFSPENEEANDDTTLLNTLIWLAKNTPHQPFIYCDNLLKLLQQHKSIIENNFIESFKRRDFFPTAKTFIDAYNSIYLDIINQLSLNKYREVNWPADEYYLALHLDEILPVKNWKEKEYITEFRNQLAVCILPDMILENGSFPRMIFRFVEKIEANFDNIYFSELRTRLEQLLNIFDGPVEVFYHHLFSITSSYLLDLLISPHSKIALLKSPLKF